MSIRALYALALVAVVYGVAASQIHAAPAFYPRLTLLNDTAAAAVIETPSNGTAELTFVVRTALAPNEAWAPLAVIAADNSANVDLANGFLHVLDDGTLLCAYRHHTDGPNGRVYRIQLSASTNGGMSWSLRATVAQGPTGVWEPFLYRHSSNMSVLHVVYSAELTNGGEQDVVQQDSLDGGVTWSAITARVHTPNSRNGMPGVVELRDASLVMIMEGFWTGVWGHYTVNAVRSFDGGYTWTQPAIVYAPSVASGFNAGSPQVAVCPSPGLDYKIVAVYMCNEPLGAAGRALPPAAAWPDGAQVHVQTAHLDASNASMPLNWTQGKPALVPTSTPTAFWPSLLLDRVGGIATVRAAYQAADGSAQVNADTLCLNALAHENDAPATPTTPVVPASAPRPGGAPTCRVSVSNATEEAIYVQARDGCSDTDFPDVPARFFRALDGSVTLLDGNSLGFHRSVRAPGGSAWVRDCVPVLTSGDTGPSQTPAEYNNSLWIQACWALDDVRDNVTGTVVALLHNEFHGERATANASLCPSGVLADCWYANALAGVSFNGGAHFAPLPYAQRTTMVSPDVYVPGGGRQGMTAVSNIVRGGDGALYVLAARENVATRNGTLLPPGVCVWRTANVSDPSAWRGWDGTGYTVVSANPYAGGGGDACVATAPINLRFSLVFSDVCNAWISVGVGEDAGGNSAFVYATSADLVSWSTLTPLRTVRTGGGYPQQVYAAIVDVDYAAAGTNFDHAGATPHLYYTRFNAGNDRDLVRQQLLVETSTQATARM